MPMTEEYETDQAAEGNNLPDQSFSKVQKKKKKQINDAQFISNEAFNTVEKNNHRKRADSNGNQEVIHSRNAALPQKNSTHEPQDTSNSRLPPISQKSAKKKKQLPDDFLNQDIVHIKEEDQKRPKRKHKSKRIKTRQTAGEDDDVQSDDDGDKAKIIKQKMP